MVRYDPYEELERERRSADGREAWRERGRAFMRWLSRRPAESWLFLAAGVVIGGILF
ncbi:MAG: hypothetical protein MI723_19100 [Caulobacterales bacterium]|nr:hypothetical protein [Caulobacterales bacterium]